VAAAVRQFDQAVPGRRWQKRRQRQARFRRLLAAWPEGERPGWLGTACWTALVLLALAAGYWLGSTHVPAPSAPPTSTAPATPP
jgi:hypothetical protein